MTLRFFTVAGDTLFPFEMLYIDRAWPASAADAETIEFACPTQHPRVTITLASYQAPSPDRWALHKWPVQRIQS